MKAITVSEVDAYVYAKFVSKRERFLYQTQQRVMQRTINVPTQPVQCPRSTKHILNW